MKDFILTLVVVFVIFKILGSFRSEQKKKVSRDYEEGSQNPSFDKDGTRVEIIKDKKKDLGEFTDYEIIDEEDDEKKDGEKK
jgi:hypothetical protein